MSVVVEISNRNACIYRPNNREHVCLSWLKFRTDLDPYGSGHYVETVVHTTKGGFRKDTDKTGQPSIILPFPLSLFDFF